MAGQKTISCTYQGTPTPLEPVLWKVTGNGSPSPNGDYYAIDDIDGKPAALKSTGDYRIYYDGLGELYSLEGFPAIGNFPYWSRAGDNPIGSYTPIINCTGNPVVSLP